MIRKEVEPTTRNKGATWEATQDSFREFFFSLISYPFYFILFYCIVDYAKFKCGGGKPYYLRYCMSLEC